MVFITMVIVSPLSRDIPLANGRFMAYKWAFQDLDMWFS